MFFFLTHQLFLPSPMQLLVVILLLPHSSACPSFTNAASCCNCSSSSLISSSFLEIHLPPLQCNFQARIDHNWKLSPSFAIQLPSSDRSQITTQALQQQQQQASKQWAKVGFHTWVEIQLPCSGIFFCFFFFFFFLLLLLLLYAGQYCPGLGSLVGASGYKTGYQAVIDPGFSWNF